MDIPISEVLEGIEDEYEEAEGSRGKIRWISWLWD
jgi:hypothetical protein